MYNFKLNFGYVLALQGLLWRENRFVLCLVGILHFDVGPCLHHRRRNHDLWNLSME